MKEHRRSEDTRPNGYTVYIGYFEKLLKILHEKGGFEIKKVYRDDYNNFHLRIFSNGIILDVTPVKGGAKFENSVMNFGFILCEVTITRELPDVVNQDIITDTILKDGWSSPSIEIEFVDSMNYIINKILRDHYDKVDRPAMVELLDKWQESWPPKEREEVDDSKYDIKLPPQLNMVRLD